MIIKIHKEWIERSFMYTFQPDSHMHRSCQLNQINHNKLFFSELTEPYIHFIDRVTL